MLEAVAVLHDEAVGPIAQIHGVVRPEESRPHRGSDPVGADQHVAREGLAALGPDPHAVRPELAGAYSSNVEIEELGDAVGERLAALTGADVGGLYAGCVAAVSEVKS